MADRVQIPGYPDCYIQSDGKVFKLATTQVTATSLVPVGVTPDGKVTIRNEIGTLTASVEGLLKLCFPEQAVGEAKAEVVDTFKPEDLVEPEVKPIPGPRPSKSMGQTGVDESGNFTYEEGHRKANKKKQKTETPEQ